MKRKPFPTRRMLLARLLFPESSAPMVSDTCRASSRPLPLLFCCSFPHWKTAVTSTTHCWILLSATTPHFPPSRPPLSRIGIGARSFGTPCTSGNSTTSSVRPYNGARTYPSAAAAAALFQQRCFSSSFGISGDGGGSASPSSSPGSSSSSSPVTTTMTASTSTSCSSTFFALLSRRLLRLGFRGAMHYVVLCVLVAVLLEPWIHRLFSRRSSSSSSYCAAASTASTSSTTITTTKTTVDQQRSISRWSSDNTAPSTPILSSQVAQGDKGNPFNNETPILPPPAYSSPPADLDPSLHRAWEEWKAVEQTLQPGDILLMRGTGLVSSIIAAGQLALSRFRFSASPLLYSHVAVVAAPAQWVVVDDDEVDGAAHGCGDTSTTTTTAGAAHSASSVPASGPGATSLLESGSPTTTTTTMTATGLHHHQGDAGPNREDHPIYHTDAQGRRLVYRGAVIMEGMVNDDTRVRDVVVGAPLVKCVQCVLASDRLFSKDPCTGKLAYSRYAIRRLIRPADLMAPPPLLGGSSVVPGRRVVEVDGREARHTAAASLSPLSGVSSSAAVSPLNTTSTSSSSTSSSSCSSSNGFNDLVWAFALRNEGRPLDTSPLYFLAYVSPTLHDWLRPDRQASGTVSCSELITELYQHLGVVQREWRWVPLSSSPLSVEADFITTTGSNPSNNTMNTMMNDKTSSNKNNHHHLVDGKEGRESRYRSTTDERDISPSALMETSALEEWRTSEGQLTVRKMTSKDNPSHDNGYHITDYLPYFDYWSSLLASSLDAATASTSAAMPSCLMASLSAYLPVVPLTVSHIDGEEHVALDTVPSHTLRAGDLARAKPQTTTPTLLRGHQDARTKSARYNGSSDESNDTTETVPTATASSEEGVHRVSGEGMTCADSGAHMECHEMRLMGNHHHHHSNNNNADDEPVWYQLQWRFRHRSMCTSPFQFTSPADKTVMHYAPGCGLGPEEWYVIS